MTILFQLGYAVVVSRLAGATEFGVYSVALSITALISLIANGGMSQAVARLMDLDKRVVGALTSFALILGVAVAAITFFTADFWASLWDVPDAADTIRWLSVSAILSPMFSLLTGLARRTGQFSRLATVTVSSNLIGMLLGIAAVAAWGNASSLVVSAVSAQALLVAWLSVEYRGYLGLRRLSTALPHVAFSLKLVVAGILQYAVGNLGKWSATRSFGAPVMGQWNRAEVLTTIPMQQAQSAMVQAVYPEFRHDVGSSVRAKAVWAEMLLMVAWLSAPAGMILAIVAPFLIPLILGFEWTQAAQFAVPLSIGVAIQPVSVLLASALESLGSFRRIWLTDIVLFILQIILVLSMLAANDVSIVIWGIALTNGARLLIHSTIAIRIGYLDGRTFIFGLLKVFAGCGVIIVFCKLLVFTVTLGAEGGSQSLTGWIVSGAAIAGALASVVLCWRFFPPVTLATKYGLIAPKEHP
ncbi:O-antigen/teichoic acid export membrane protein [Arthrobacter sp. PvP023]|nr:O-antigen/teichoic acid export membrane protein [Arthrobacter sp. PvP023]